MLVKEFVAQLEIDFKKDGLDKLENDNSNIYINLEAAITVRDLKDLLAQHSKDEREVNNETIKLFIDFLSRRWNRVKHTDAIYNINPNSYANRICKIIASRLEEKITKSAIQLLMPTLKEFKSDEIGSKYDLSCIKFHEWVLTDDDDYGISVSESLTHSEENITKKDKLKMTCNVNGFKRMLSDKEQERVVQHSPQATNYFNAKFNFGLKSTELGTYKTKLTKELHKSEAEFKVGSTYGNEGLKLLRKNVLTNIDMCFKDRNKFLNFLTKKFEKKDWKSFIDDCDQNAFERLFLNGSFDDCFDSVSKNEKTYEGTDIVQRAALFCLSEIYWRRREKQSNYTSYSGMLFGFPKTSKQSGVELYQNFLIGDEPLNKLGDFLKSKEEFNNPTFDGLFEKDSLLGGLFNRNPLLDGSLRNLTNQHEKIVGKMATEQKQEVPPTHQFKH